MSTYKRALSIAEFARTYGICRSKVYAEIAAGHLHAVKSGHRTLIRTEDAEAWLQSLPASNGPLRRHVTATQDILPPNVSPVKQEGKSHDRA
jgi:excisionase family DNA binding protein